MPTKPPLTAVKTVAPSLDHPNLSPVQRLLSIAAGVAFVSNGLGHSGTGALVRIAVGLGVAWRGYTGVCKLTHRFDQTAYEHFMQRDAGWDRSKAVSRSITIRRPRAEVFAFFLKPEYLARLMPWVQHAESIDEQNSRWVALGPLEKPLSWIIKQNVIQRDQALQWDTSYQGPWRHRIAATFTDAPQGQGTEVKVILAVEPFPGNAAYALAGAIARFSDRALLNLLRQVKQQMETGEVATNQMRKSFTSQASSANDEKPLTNRQPEGGE